MQVYCWNKKIQQICLYIYYIILIRIIEIEYVDKNNKYINVEVWNLTLKAIFIIDVSQLCSILLLVHWWLHLLLLRGCCCCWLHRLSCHRLLLHGLHHLRLSWHVLLHGLHLRLLTSWDHFCILLLVVWLKDNLLIFGICFGLCIFCVTLLHAKVGNTTNAAAAHDADSN